MCAPEVPWLPRRAAPPQSGPVRRWPLVLATTVMLMASGLTAAPAGAQCATGRFDARRPNPVSLFEGWYSLTAARGADGSDAQALSGLREVYVPGTVGWRVFDNRQTVEHGNFQVGDAFPVRAKWSYGVGGIGLPDFLKEAANGGWCATVDDRGFSIRMGFQQDLRYSNTLTGQRFRGVRVYASLLPGAGFPVQHYYVRDTARANAQARDFYTANPNSGRMRALPMLFSTYELVLRGGITRREWQRGHQRMLTFRPVLAGEIRHRRFHDARVGVPGHTAAGSEVRLWVELSGGREHTVTLAGSEDAQRRAELLALVRQVCGSTRGCSVPQPTALPAGLLRIRGSDDAERFADRCASLNGNKACDAPTNPYVGRTEPTRAELSDLSSPAATGRQTTEAERTRARSGNRTPDASAPANLAHWCLRLRQQDSTRWANGPVPVGGTRPPYRPTSRVPASCLVPPPR